jgi:hypothetical protein
MIKTKVSGMCLALMTLLTTTALDGDGRSPSLPVYEVLRTGTPIEVDGVLVEKVWANAPPFRDFLMNLDGSPSPVKTVVRALYDDNFLYFSFRCRDDNIWATLKKRDEHLWEEEVVEVFLQADPHQSSYVELEVNPLGTMLDIYLLDMRKPLHYESWNSEKLKWAVQVTGTVDGKGGDQEWTCEIAVPLEDIVTAPHLPPKAADRWRMNLYRVETKPTPLSLAWSPTLKDDFHLPAMFGELVFSERQVK